MSSKKVDVAAIFDAKKEIRIFRFVMFVITLILAIYSYVVFATPRVGDKIYTDLQSNHYCGRRLNATAQMGCTSALGGNQGVVWVVNDQKDLDHILKTGPTPPYVVVLGHAHFSKDNILTFKKNVNRVAGVIFKNDNPSAPPTPFSPDDVCPNRYWGLYPNDTSRNNCKTNQWQKTSQISGLLYEDIPFPIFFMNEAKSLTEIDDCFQKNVMTQGSEKLQASYPLCGIQLDSFMSAAVDVETCFNYDSVVEWFYYDQYKRQRRWTCKPVESSNIFAYYKTAKGKPNKLRDNIWARPLADKQSTVMLASKLSSISMFSGISPGADSTITSIVTLMAVAEALGHSEIRNSTKVRDSQKNIVFALFDSEPFDYLGSTAMASAMKADSFPSSTVIVSENPPADTVLNSNISSLSYVINLDQLAPHNEDLKLYLHSNPEDENKGKVDKVTQLIQEKAQQVRFNIDNYDQLPLPPTSVQQFVKESLVLDKDVRLTGVVLSNYGKTYTNQFYHSVHDDALGVGLSLTESRLVNHLKQVSTIVARSIYELAFDDKIDIETNSDVIREMLLCYLKDSNCTLFQRLMPPGQKPISGPVSTFWDSTKESDDFNLYVSRTLLAYFLGDKTRFDAQQCVQQNQASSMYEYSFINGQDKPVDDTNKGICLQHQVLSTSSSSLAYKRRSQDDIIWDINKQYPVWTASLNRIRNPVRVFLISSPLYGWIILIFGLITTITTSVFVNHLKFVIASQVNNQAQPTST